MDVSEELWDAARDLRYLLNRGYPRETSLQLVGNRYNLTRDLRHILRRGVFPNRIAAERKQKTVSLKALRGHELAVDGHNVLITLETALNKETILCADDGFIRDISEVSGRYRKGEATDDALHLISELLTNAGPSEVLFLLDSPISGSGELAAEFRSLLSRAGITGDAKAVKVPERVLEGYNGVIASSDTAVIDQAQRVFDVAGHIIRQRLRVPIVSLERQK